MGPLFAWSAAVGEVHKEVKIPWAVCFILLYLADRFDKGDRLAPPPSRAQPAGILFKTDASADEHSAWVGGWEPHVSGDTKRSRWFALKVTPDWAPWAFIKKNPQRVIASLELLGTVLGVMRFSDRWVKGCRGTMVGRAITDNMGNSFVVAKQMSTKFPLTLLLMELTEWLKEKDLMLDLHWVPRDQNEEADELSNMDPKNFSEELEIKVDPFKIRWKLMDSLLKASTELYENIVESKKAKRQVVLTAAKRKVKLLEKW